MVRVLQVAVRRLHEGLANNKMGPHLLMELIKEHVNTFQYSSRGGACESLQ